MGIFSVASIGVGQQGGTVSSNGCYERAMDVFDRLCDAPTPDRESMLNEACAESEV